MAEELKACPFCSCTDIGEVTINPRLKPHHRRFKVYCKVCQCRTSEHKTRKEARIYWNTRAHPTQQGEAVEVVAWVNPSDLNLMSRYGYHSCTAKAVKVPCFTEPLMTVAQHERITAAMAVESERLRLLERVLDDVRAERDELVEASCALRAELAAIKGQGLRTDPVKAQLLEALESCLELIETICPVEGSEVRKAKAALAASTGQEVGK